MLRPPAKYRSIHTALCRRVVCRCTRLIYTLSRAAEHDKPNHPETAARIDAVDQALRQQGFHRRDDVVELNTTAHAWQHEDVLAALQLVHPAAYLTRLKDICDNLQEPTMVDESTYIAPGSFMACCDTAAAVLAVLDAVLVGTQLSGVCLVRPPGHHVLPSRPMGFGLLNFMAVAAAYALRQQTHTLVNKVLIIDWDVHHGNGTQDIFYADPAVMYISTHQQGLWPYTGKVSQQGTGAGTGYTINVPLPGGSGHEAMQMVVDQVIRPAAHKFKPDIIMVSAGFDAHWRDPLAALQFESRTYHMLFQKVVHLAQELCNGRCIFILEGGYDQGSLKEAVVHSMLGILHEPVDHVPVVGLTAEPLEKLQNAINQACGLHNLSR